MDNTTARDLVKRYMIAIKLDSDAGRLQVLAEAEALGCAGLVISAVAQQLSEGVSA